MEKPRSSRQRRHCSFILIPSLVFRCSLILNQLQSRVDYKPGAVWKMQATAFPACAPPVFWRVPEDMHLVPDSLNCQKGQLLCLEPLAEHWTEYCRTKVFLFCGSKTSLIMLPLFSSSLDHIRLFFFLALCLCLPVSLSLHIKKHICHWRTCIF